MTTENNITFVPAVGTEPKAAQPTKKQGKKIMSIAALTKKFSKASITDADLEAFDEYMALNAPERTVEVDNLISSVNAHIKANEALDADTVASVKGRIKSCSKIKEVFLHYAEQLIAFEGTFEAFKKEHKTIAAAKDADIVRAEAIIKLEEAGKSEEEICTILKISNSAAYADFKARSFDNYSTWKKEQTAKKAAKGEAKEKGAEQGATVAAIETDNSAISELKNNLAAVKDELDKAKAINSTYKLAVARLLASDLSEEGKNLVKGVLKDSVAQQLAEAKAEREAELLETKKRLLKEEKVEELKLDLELGLITLVELFGEDSDAATFNLDGLEVDITKKDLS